MPMPFPGMDPYLEHPILWPSVHMRLIVALANQLGPRLRPHYVASVEERVFIEDPDLQRIPDAWIQKTRPEGHGRTAAAGTATANPLVVELRVRYDQPSVPSLSPEDQEWAFERWTAYCRAHPELLPDENGR